MKTKKGFIESIIFQDGIGIIKEDTFQTTFIFFLDDYTKPEIKQMTPGTEVTFDHDKTDFNMECFVATNVSVKSNEFFNMVAS